jgi:hypothetical protein
MNLSGSRSRCVTGCLVVMRPEKVAALQLFPIPPVRSVYLRISYNFPLPWGSSKHTLDTGG